MADNLPAPESRVESYLAKAAGEDVTIPEKPLSRLEQYLDAIAEGGGGGGGGSYTAGDGIDIANNTISVDTDTIQEKLTAGTGIDITDNTISATGGGGPTVVQTTGTSTTDVMSQNATTSMVFDDPAAQANIKIGERSSVTNPNGGVTIGERATGGRDAVTIGGQASGAVSGGVTIGHSATGTSNSVAIGYLASSGNRSESVAIGHSAGTGGAHPGSVALGAYAVCTRTGEVYIGSSNTSYGYDSTAYRILGGVHDGVDAHDAVTVEQVNATIDAINTALSTSIPHIGATS